MDQDLFWHLWAKKLAGEANKEELELMEELLKKHPELVYSAEKIEEIWKLQPQNDASLSKDSFSQHLSFMEKEGVDISSWADQNEQQAIVAKSRIPKWLYVSVAACFIGLASFLFFHYSSTDAVITKNKFSEVSTRLGSKSKLVLPDGSTVWLNAGSKLSYEKNFGTESRHVVLNGEAFFDVVKMPDLPFIIETKAIKIKVLGTSFNVRSYEDEPTTETSLIHGKVEITINKRPDEIFYLKPNQKLVVANDLQAAEEAQHQQNKRLVSLEQLTYLPRDSSVVETSWKENKLVFQDESFHEIAKKMERWYNVRINFNDSQIENIRLSGSFETETVTQALEALQITTPFQFIIEQNNIKIFK